MIQSNNNKCRFLEVMVTTDFFVLIRNARASQVLNGFSFEQHLVSINKALIEARSRSIPHHSYPKTWT